MTMMSMYPVIIILFATLALRNVAVKKLVTKIDVETTMVMVLFINAFFAMMLYFFVFDRKTIMQNIGKLVEKRDPVLLLPWFASLVGITFTYVYYRIIEVKELYFVSLVLSIFPVFVAIAAYIFLNETMNLYQMLAMFIILSGVVLLNVSSDKK